MLTALLATPAGLHNCQTCWVHHVRLHDPGQCQPSQSQWGEEKWLLEHFFAEKRNGVYVELGAVDGVRFSNTLALHTCRDWTGVLVEANRANYHLLRVNAPKYRGAGAKYHHGAVCAPPQQNVSFTTQGGPASADLSQMSTVFKQQWHRGSTVSTEDVVPCRPMSHYVRELTHIDLFSLDVEGAELEALLTLDLTRVQVDVFLIELTSNDVESSRKSYEIVQLMQNLGYKPCGGPPKPFCRDVWDRASGACMNGVFVHPRAWTAERRLACGLNPPRRLLDVSSAPRAADHASHGSSSAL